MLSALASLPDKMQELPSSAKPLIGTVEEFYIRLLPVGDKPRQANVVSNLTVSGTGWCFVNNRNSRMVCGLPCARVKNVLE